MSLQDHSTHFTPVNQDAHTEQSAVGNEKDVGTGLSLKEKYGDILELNAGPEAPSARSYELTWTCDAQVIYVNPTLRLGSEPFLQKELIYEKELEIDSSFKPHPLLRFKGYDTVEVHQIPSVVLRKGCAPRGVDWYFPEDSAGAFILEDFPDAVVSLFYRWTHAPQKGYMTRSPDDRIPDANAFIEELPLHLCVLHFAQQHGVQLLQDQAKQYVSYGLASAGTYLEESQQFEDWESAITDGGYPQKEFLRQICSYVVQRLSDYPGLKARMAPWLKSLSFTFANLFLLEGDESDADVKYPSGSEESSETEADDNYEMMNVDEDLEFFKDKTAKALYLEKTVLNKKAEVAHLEVEKADLLAEETSARERAVCVEAEIRDLVGQAARKRDAAALKTAEAADFDGQASSAWNDHYYPLENRMIRCLDDVNHAKQALKDLEKGASAHDHEADVLIAAAREDVPALKQSVAQTWADIGDQHRAVASLEAMLKLELRQGNYDEASDLRDEHNVAFQSMSRQHEDLLKVMYAAVRAAVDHEAKKAEYYTHREEALRLTAELRKNETEVAVLEEEFSRTQTLVKILEGLSEMHQKRSETSAAAARQEAQNRQNEAVELDQRAASLRQDLGRQHARAGELRGQLASTGNVVARLELEAAKLKLDAEELRRCGSVGTWN